MTSSRMGSRAGRVRAREHEGEHETHLFLLYSASTELAREFQKNVFEERQLTTLIHEPKAIPKLIFPSDPPEQIRREFRRGSRRSMRDLRDRDPKVNNELAGSRPERTPASASGN